jgi:hypothetical protein|tara:strand:- start:130 stop:342 length:213 start_codon:yes stop_codon:yes gene_type:complete
MKLREFYEPAKDTIQQRHKTDTRKKMLSLEELGKLRKIRELKKAEAESHKKLASVMYAKPVDGGGAGGLL